MPQNNTLGPIMFVLYFTNTDAACFCFHVNTASQKAVILITARHH